MSNAMMISLTGLGAFGKKLDVTANNTANVNTDGFKKSRAEMAAAYPDGVKVTIGRENTPGDYVVIGDGTPAMKESSNVSLEEEMTGLITTKNMYESNLMVIRTDDEMKGELLDIKA